MKEKILIIGGSGFIGSHVSEELTKKKFDVTILDKKKTNYLLNGQTFLNFDIKEKLKLKNDEGADGVIETYDNKSFIYQLTLLENNYEVTVLDLMIYGENVLPNNKNLKIFMIIFDPFFLNTNKVNLYC